MRKLIDFLLGNPLILILVGTWVLGLIGKALTGAGQRAAKAAQELREQHRRRMEQELQQATAAADAACPKQIVVMSGLMPHRPCAPPILTPHAAMTSSRISRTSHSRVTRLSSGQKLSGATMPLEPALGSMITAATRSAPK